MGTEQKQEDSKDFEYIKYELTILICGDYNDKIIEKDLSNIKKCSEKKNFTYIKTGNHTNIHDWKYYFFAKNSETAKNTFNFIESQVQEGKRKNLIIFFCDLNDFSAKDLLSFYDTKSANYHPQFIIVTKSNHNFYLPSLSKINPNFIKIVEEDNLIELMIYMNEITSYYNELGDEIGFPKKFVNKELIDKDSSLLMAKDLFTINILICGKPGCGKSTLINKILGKNKCFSGIGTSSLTQRIVKYIHDEYPIVVYDTPGFETKENVESVRRLVKDKNKDLKEQKNRIHCVLYLLNKETARTFQAGEYEFLVSLIEEKMNVFILATHAQNEGNSADYIEAIKIDLLSCFQKNLLKEITDNIFPVELIGNEYYQKFGVKNVFTTMYERFKDQKVYETITENNIEKVKSIFFKDINSKKSMICHISALAKRVRGNFKLLASSDNSINIKGTTMLSIAVIKIISSLYNNPINTDKCLKIIKENKYTDQTAEGFKDTNIRKIEKAFALLYTYGVAGKEIDYLATQLIEGYSASIEDDKNFYDLINNYKIAINKAIDSLQYITD